MKVYILIKQYPYEGDTHGPAFSSEELANEHMQALNAEQGQHDEKWEVEDWDVLDETPHVVEYCIKQIAFDQNGAEIASNVHERTQWSYYPPLEPGANFTCQNYVNPPVVYVNGYGATQAEADEQIQAKKKQAVSQLNVAIKRKKKAK